MEEKRKRGRRKKDDGESCYFGKYYTPYSIVHALPEVGETILLKESVQHERHYKGGQCKEEVYYKDEQGEPRVYTVESYSEGIDRPLSKTNSMLLSFPLGKKGGGCSGRAVIKTILITCGYLDWERTGGCRATGPKDGRQP